MSGKRHTFASITIVVFATFICVAALSADEPTGNRQSPFAKLRPVKLEDVRWTGGDASSGFWAERIETLRRRSIPAMWEIMKGDKYKPFYQHFLIASGDIDGEYHGAQWNDGDFYKFLEAVSATYAIARDPEFEHILEQSVGAIGRAQRADGYIHTPVLIRQRNGEPAKPFENRLNFEMYNMGHLITAACVHHQVTGRDQFLTIARKAADFLDETFRTPTPELAKNSVCPSHYMAMVDLFRTTGEPRYLELARKFLAMRAMVEDGGDDNQDRIPFVEQREAVGHAVRANYLYAGAADLYLETGDAALWKSLDSIWQNVVGKKMYITGGCGALYDGASPDGSEDQSHITRVHQSYGRNYQLPNTTAHNETCAAIGNVLWNWRMFLATGEARFIDVLELSLFNAVLSGVSLDGDDYFYVNPLRQLDPLPTDLRWSRTRVPFVTSYCCPPNVLRTIAEVNGYAYCTSDDAIWVNLYGANRLTTTLLGKPLVLEQSTDYPWDGIIRIQIRKCSGDEFALKLRVPGWASAATWRLSDSSTNSKLEPNSYAELRRRWKPGDVVELRLGMVPRLMESHPLVEETRNQVAIQCGPIVYCLESHELPKDIRISDVAINKNAERRLSFRPALLQGVGVVETSVAAGPSPVWQQQLYRPLSTRNSTTATVRFIPYFAWANRGASEMTVWLPIE
jgi:DUF1680 family protein